MIILSDILRSSQYNLFPTLLVIFLIVSFSADNSFAEENLQDSMNLAGEYIVNSTNPDGMFDYVVDPLTNKVDQREYWQNHSHR